MNRDYGAEFLELDGLFGDSIAVKSIVSKLIMGKLRLGSKTLGMPFKANSG